MTLCWQFCGRMVLRKKNTSLIVLTQWKLPDNKTIIEVSFVYKAVCCPTFAIDNKMLERKNQLNCTTFGMQANTCLIQHCFRQVNWVRSFSRGPQTWSKLVINGMFKWTVMFVKANSFFGGDILLFCLSFRENSSGNCETWNKWMHGRQKKKLPVGWIWDVNFELANLVAKERIPKHFQQRLWGKLEGSPWCILLSGQLAALGYVRFIQIYWIDAHDSYVSRNVQIVVPFDVCKLFLNLPYERKNMRYKFAA